MSYLLVALKSPWTNILRAPQNERGTSHTSEPSENTQRNCFGLFKGSVELIASPREVTQRSFNEHKAAFLLFQSVRISAVSLGRWKGGTLLSKIHPSKPFYALNPSAPLSGFADKRMERLGLKPRSLCQNLLPMQEPSTVCPTGFVTSHPSQSHPLLPQLRKSPWGWGKATQCSRVAGSSPERSSKDRAATSVPTASVPLLLQLTHSLECGV